MHEQIDERSIDKVLMVEGLMMNWRPLQKVLCMFYQLTPNFPPNASFLLSGKWVGGWLLPIKASEVIYVLITGWPFVSKCDRHVLGKLLLMPK